MRDPRQKTALIAEMETQRGQEFRKAIEGVGNDPKDAPMLHPENTPPLCLTHLPLKLKKTYLKFKKSPNAESPPRTNGPRNGLW